MADNFDIRVAGGSTITVGATDNTNVFYPWHIQVDASGNKQPAGDATARPVFVKVTNGTIDLGIFAEDAAHSSGHVGIMPLGVRNDTHTSAFSGTDGDYTPLGLDSSGKLGIRGTFAEDAANTSGDLGIHVLAVRSDTAAATGTTDGDYCSLIVDSTGRLYVNVATFTPGTDAGSLGKAEDAAHNSGDTGVFMLAVRADTAAVTSGTDGDYSGLIVDSSGRLHVNVGSFTPGTAAGSLGKAEDAGHSSGDTGVMALAVRNDADADLAGTTLDYSPIATDSAGRVKVNAVSEYVVLDVTPTCDTSAYDAGDVLFDRVSCGTVTRLNGGYAVLDSVVVLDQDDNTAAAMTLYFLDSDVTLGTAGAAVSISDANALKIVGRVSIADSDFTDLIGSKIAVKNNLNLPMKADAASKLIYVAATTAGTPTQTASGIKLKVGFKRG